VSLDLLPWPAEPSPTIGDPICSIVMRGDVLLAICPTPRESPDEDTHAVIMDRKCVALTYLRTWFAIDLISAFPFEWVIASSFGFVQLLKVLIKGHVLWGVQRCICKQQHACPPRPRWLMPWMAYALPASTDGCSHSKVHALPGVVQCPWCPGMVLARAPPPPVAQDL
jgi:hypothetical protein